MQGGFPNMFQALSTSGTRMMANPLLVLPLWNGFVIVPWLSRRYPRIVMEKDPMSHVSCMQYPCMLRLIIILIVFSSLSLPIKPCMFWLSTRHSWGKVSLVLECYSLHWLAAGSCLLDLLLPSHGNLCWIAMAWTMELIGSSGFRSEEGEGAGGANLRRVQQGLFSQFSAAGRFLWVICVPVADDSMPRKWLRDEDNQQDCPYVFS